MNKNGIAIVGISAKMPGCDDYQAFQKAIFEGEVQTGRPITGQRQEDIEHVFGNFRAAPMSYLDRVDLFDYSFFGVSKGEAARMRPEQRFMLEQAVTCMLNAGKSLEEMRGSNTGIFATKGDSQFKLMFGGNSKSGMAEQSQSMDVTRIAYTLDLRGPALIVDTTCSSSLVALHLACQNILDETCDQALVGGCSLWVIPEESVASSPILSQKRACTAFDDSADGTLFGEGALMLLLKREDKAIEDGDFVHAVIDATHLNHGGARIANITAPSPEAQAETLIKTWKKAGIDPKDIAYIESHGTGTVLGDPIEIKGIYTAIEHLGSTDTQIAIGAIKSQFGHLDGASGLAGLVKLVLAGNQRQIPPLVNFTQLNKNIEEAKTIQFPLHTTNWPTSKNYGAVSSFGVSGTNAHVVVRFDETSNLPEEEQFDYCLVLNASSNTALNNIRKKLLTTLSSCSNGEAQALCKTVNRSLQSGTDQKVYVAATKESLVAQLSETIPDNISVKTSEVSCFISHNSDIDPAHFDRSRRIFPALNEVYQSILELTGDKASDSEVVRFTRITAYVQWLSTIGLDISKLIVSGIGELVSDFLNQRMEMDEILQKLVVLKPEFSSDKFKAYVNTLQGNKTHLSIHIGTTGEMGTILQEALTDHNLIVASALEELTTQVLTKIAVRQSSGVYGKNYKTYPLVVDVFNRERCWPKTEPRTSLVSQEEPVISDTQTTEQSVVTKEIVSAAILEIWKEILGAETIALTDDFFEIGGTSLMGLDIQDELKAHFQVNLNYEDIFDHSTIEKLTDRVLSIITASDSPKQEVDQTSGKLESEEQRTEQYRQKLNQLNAFVPEFVTPNKVLLTGSTGYLGIHLLKIILDESEASVICPVRDADEAVALKRLESQFTYHFPEVTFPSERVVIIAADLLSDELPKISGIDAIYHSAALVSHYGKYELSESINLNMTVKLANWAIENGVKKFIQMSTSAVAGAALPDHRSIYHFYETDGNIGQQFNGNIYPETKFKAEEYLRSKSSEFELSICRIANISAHSHSGIFQQNVSENSSMLFLRDLIHLGSYPTSLLNGKTNINPVDKVAKAVFLISKLQNSPVTNYHINDHEVISFGEVVTEIKRAGIPLSEHSDDVFVDSLGSNPELNAQTLPMITILKNRRQAAHADVIFETELTRLILEKSAFNWKYDKAHFLHQLIIKQIQVGFFRLDSTTYNSHEINEIKENFKSIMGYELNLEQPGTFNEKIQHRIVFGDHPLMAKLADKLAVRDYVQQKVGSKYLIPLFGVFDSISEPDLEKLPATVVIKNNHASGPKYMQVFVDGKPTYPANEQTVSQVLNRINTAKNDRYGDISGEKFYNLIKPKILAEKYLQEPDGSPLREYKLFCFKKEKQKIIATMAGRTEHLQITPLFFDENWNKLQITASPDTNLDDYHLDRPENLEEMLHVADKLSEDFDFVRVDLYLVNGKLYFGELTNTPNGGYQKLYPETWDTTMGNLFEQTNW